MESIITNKKLRTKKTRKEGITMMIDKGISLSQAKYFLETSKEYTDIIKLGFGTSIITPNIIEKVRLYQKNNIQVYLGGTLFEYFFSRNKIKEYEDFVNYLGISMVEISVLKIVCGVNPRKYKSTWKVYQTIIFIITFVICIGIK